MSPAIVIFFPGNENLATQIAKGIGCEAVPIAIHRFPDEETLVRFDRPLHGRDIVLVCALDRPDSKFLPLAFAAGTAKELGARSAGLVAPYLAYMRQDARFAPGQAISAVRFAEALGGVADWLVTVDPHLHRLHALKEIYSIPARIVSAAPRIADWIARNVPSPVIVGPDSESAQWVSNVARLGGFPYAVWTKSRGGDKDVRIAASMLEIGSGRTPVLVDDIISTGETMAAAIRSLKAAGMPAPVCIGVHAVFAPGAMDTLQSAGPSRLVTTNTIAHQTNVIDLAPDIAADVAALLGGGNLPPGT